MDDSNIEFGESVNDTEISDWYHSDSDTDEEIPDPNKNPEPLFQDVDQLPEPLQKKHFQEGFIFAMTLLEDKRIIHLGMIVLVSEHTFLFRLFAAKGTSRKTFHEGRRDKQYNYKEI